ncbi:hypothetical protein KIPB_009709, partial [Kipferlia bialata]
VEPTVVCPHCALVSPTAPACPVISSGRLCVPSEQPVCVSAVVGTGRLIVCGSTLWMADTSYQKDHNSMVLGHLFSWLSHSRQALDLCPASPPVVQEGGTLPDTAALAHRYRPKLLAPESLPADFRNMVSLDVYDFDTSLLPEVLELYKNLGLNYEPLQLEKPAFEQPKPPLQASVHVPRLSDTPCAPSLELFDLDEEFASNAVRLARLTARSIGDKEVDFYISQVGHLLGITEHTVDASPKAVLSHVLSVITQFKRAGV